VRTRDLVGRTITAVNLNRFATGRSHNPFSFEPVIHLDDGTRLAFFVVETDVGRYGVEIVHVKRNEEIAVIK